MNEEKLKLGNTDQETFELCEKYNMALLDIKDILSKIDFEDIYEWIPPKEIKPILDIVNKALGDKE